jgi:hypothetical protein
METSHSFDNVLARAEVEMIRVAQDDLRSGPAYVVSAEPADNAMGAHGHERWSQH